MNKYRPYKSVYQMEFFKSNLKYDSASFVFTAFTGIYYQNSITESESLFANIVNSRGNDFNFQKVFRNIFRFMLSLQWIGQSFDIQWNCKSHNIIWVHITYLKFKSNIPRSITIRSIDDRSGSDKEIKKNKGNSKPKPVYTQAST